jgi:hypothetical protein
MNLNTSQHLFDNTQYKAFWCLMQRDCLLKYSNFADWILVVALYWMWHVAILQLELIKQCAMLLECLKVDYETMF